MIGAKTHIKLHFDSEREARIIYSVLKPELASAHSNKASVDFTRRKNEIGLEIKAADAASFRAALNSYMRWIIVSLQLIKRRN
ncbi:MAG: KEOPS complex subunit Pcc1 [Methanobacteriota archaeon]